MFLYVLSVTWFLLGTARSQETGQQNGQEARVVDQGSAGQTIAECTNYQLTLGKFTNYFYTCCGEWKVDNPTTGTEEMVENWDCYPRDIIYTEENKTSFYCNGDAGQAAARGICNARWGWLATNECWAWTACFAGACSKEASEPGSASLFDGFCGDGRCDANEDTTSCPVDCCPHENPDECMIKNNTCTEACCSEQTCCASSTESFFANFWVIVFSVIGGIFVLINICCCCCCYCFYRRCKGVTREKRHPTKVDRQDTTMTVLSMK